MPLDAHRCAELHNKLMRIGWEGTGRSFDEAPFATFWDENEARHHEILAIASNETIEFYKKALVHIRSQWSMDQPHQNMFYFVQGLTQPWTEFNWEAVRYLNGQGNDKVRYIMLHVATNLESHYAGILLDQDTGKAILQSSLWSSNWDDLQLLWQPLADILTAYLDMVETRKVIAGDFKSQDHLQRYGEVDPQHPWIMKSYSEATLASTIASYERMIRAIEARMPNGDENTTSEGGTLANDDLLDRGGFPKACFARSFLTTAKLPKRSSLKFIAPGISLPSEASFSTQPFKELAQQFPHPGSLPGRQLDIPDDDDPLYPPLLIFPNATTSSDETRFPDNNLSVQVEEGEDGPLFFYPFNDPGSLPSGLYIDTCAPWSATPHEDASVMLLPFPVGGNAGHAKYNDDVAFERSSTCNLYQTRFNPFIIGHRTQLHLILDSWANMVERGHWEVDERGVAGGIDVFRTVDQSDGVASRYTTTLHW